MNFSSVREHFKQIRQICVDFSQSAPHCVVVNCIISVEMASSVKTRATKSTTTPRSFTKDDLWYCRHAWSIYNDLVLASYETATEVKFISETVGSGMFASEDLDEGQVVIECTGDRLPTYIIDHIEKEYNFDGDNCEYMIMTNSGKLAIDASVNSAHAWRYINHGCNPNCKYFTIDLSEQDERSEGPIEVVFVYTLRKVTKGEQLTCGYYWSRQKCRTTKPCRCGSINCSEVAGIRGYPLVVEEVLDGEGRSGYPIGSKRSLKFNV